MASEIQFFETPSAMRAWLRKNHDKATELHLGYFKNHTGKRSMTWPESVAEALCYGWIDGVRRKIDDDRYTVRFTPRKRGSTWSAVNIRLVAELEASGRMTAAGRAAFAARKEAKSRTYSYEQKEAGLDETRMRRFKKEKPAWKFFLSQAPSYRKKAIWWIMSAKQEEAKDRRFA
ncbi:MAG: YdeI/OmpD-associated family protein, partial [Phycisphaerales bacterium]|nr:YdeI/OmpD-associated family protein [Phycisphaerales bacterium]